MPHYCQNKNNSCSACCGIYNINFSYQEIKEWLENNTKIFLATDISKAENIVAFRKEREETIEGKRYREDIYVCPFVGYIEEHKTGCLLHPQGSPHKQIHLWEYPQNFSFYGEGICLVYDCKNKEDCLLEDYHDDFKDFTYGQITANYNLNLLIRSIATSHSIDITKIYKVVQDFLVKENLPVTSFEIPLNISNYSIDEYWDVFGSLLTKEAYFNETFITSTKGKKIGSLLKQLLFSR